MSHFTLKIQTKPYIKSFLESNCGEPVDLRHIPLLYGIFVKGLCKDWDALSESNPQSNKTWSEIISIIIPPDVFYRNGFVLNYGDIMMLNKEAEKHLKFLMRSYVRLNSTIGHSITYSIRSFQDDFNLPEHIWNFESIKKDYQRHQGENSKFKALATLRKEINDGLLRDLAEKGDISQMLLANQISE